MVALHMAAGTAACACWCHASASPCQHECTVWLQGTLRPGRLCRQDGVSLPGRTVIGWGRYGVVCRGGLWKRGAERADGLDGGMCCIPVFSQQGLS